MKYFALLQFSVKKGKFWLINYTKFLKVQAKKEKKCIQFTRSGLKLHI